jgi:hypothetical protein
MGTLAPPRNVVREEGAIILGAFEAGQGRPSSIGLLGFVFGRKTCGKEPSGSYLKTQARKAVEKNLAAVFVYADGSKIAAYYTLSSFESASTKFPKPLRRS